MRGDDTGEHSRAITADALLVTAEQAHARADFGVIRPIVRRIEYEFGTPADVGSAARYAVLRSVLAARVGNWTEAVQRCPDRVGLNFAETGVVQALALAALRRLCEDEGHTESDTAALVIVLWAYLLEEEDPAGFRKLLTERRGTAVSDDLWDEARSRLIKRITDLLHALDGRAGRDALASWETAWAAERVAPVVIPAEAGPDGLIPLGCAAWHLVACDRRAELLHAYTTRHPELDTWTAGSAHHRSCAGALARALGERGRERVRAGEWSAALADFSTAARLGRAPGPDDRTAIGRAWKNVGRDRNGYGYSPITRIQGLELAHALLPEDSTLAAELTAELVRQGRKVFDDDPRESKSRFARALVVSPGDEGARSGLDDLLRASLGRAADGAQPVEKLHARDVRDLLRRDPECAFARMWLGDHYAGKAVTAAMRGRAKQARSAVLKMLRYDDYEGPWDEEFVDLALVDLLLDEAHVASGDDTLAGMDRRVELLSAAVDTAGPARTEIRKELHAAVLRLAERLDATATSSDIIELFLRGRMRAGVSARFDRIVRDAYLLRARIREQRGDPAGARRDRACAHRIASEPPASAGLLFDPGPGWSGHDGTGQEVLF